MRVRIRACALTLVWAASGSTLAAQAPSDPVAGPAQGTATAPSFVDDLDLGTRLVGHGLSAPLRWTADQWLAIPVALVGLGAISGFDDDVARRARGSQGAAAGAYFDAVEPLGLAYSFVVLGGMYAGGWALDRPGLRRTAVEAGAASAVAFGVVVPLLKVAFGRHRPEDGLGPHELDPFSGSYSFPSGHSTQAFALASVIAGESPHAAVDVLAYGLAASVGAARIYHDVHFLTDVLAGAALGTVVGHTMVRKARTLKGWAPALDVMSDGRPAVGLSVRF